MSTNPIVQIYVKLVRAGVRDIETVPANIRDEVAAEINEGVTF